MADLILHHYDISPYAEKLRLCFGLKGLAWRSVIVPMALPKPDLMPLSGGFRRERRLERFNATARPEVVERGRVGAIHGRESKAIRPTP